MLYFIVNYIPMNSVNEGFVVDDSNDDSGGGEDEVLNVTTIHCMVFIVWQFGISGVGWKIYVNFIL